MISTPILLFLTLLTISVSPQQVQHQNQTQNSTTTKLNSASQAYIDGCTAILQAKDAIDGSSDSWKTTFSTWVNSGSYGSSLMNYFENDQGIVSKVWIDSGYWSKSWSFNLTFYDGQYADKKFAMVQFNILNLYSEYFYQYAGLFQTQDLTVSVAYGENNQVQYTRDVHGQISIYFLDAVTQQPITEISEYNPNIKGDTVRIIFASTGSELSFTASLFTDTYYDVSFNLMVIPTFAIVYIICSLASSGTSGLITRVSFGYVVFAYISSAYIAIWTLLRIPSRDDSLNVTLFFVAAIDWAKQAFFLSKKIGRSPCGLVLFITIFPCALNFIPSIWVNLFPAICFIFPLFAKFVGRPYQCQQYLNRFHVSNWICMSLWMGYFYLYPNNLFMISPHPLLIEIFFGIIFVLLILSYLMDKSQRRRQEHLERLLLDHEAQPNHVERQQLLRALLQSNQNAPPPAVAAGRNNNRNNAAQGPRGRPQANPNREKKPRRKAFKYTFAAQGGGGQEDYTLLTDECAICFDYLLGESAEKLYKTPCGHMFHESCLRAWGVKKLECPCCRKKLPKFKRAPAN